MGSGLPDHITIEANPDISIEGLDDINVALALTMPAVELETSSKLESASKLDTKSQLEVAVTEPIVTELAANAALDLKPVVVDLCLNAKLGELPRQRIRRPYSRCYSLRLFGIEILGLRRSGESKWLIEDHRPRPLLEWGSAEPGRFEPAKGSSLARPAASPAAPAAPRGPDPDSPAGGFRISIE